MKKKREFQVQDWYTKQLVCFCFLHLHVKLTSHFIQSVQEEPYKDCSKSGWGVGIGQKGVWDDLKEDQKCKITLLNYSLSKISLHFKQRCDEKKDNCHQRGIAQLNNILSELPTLWEIYGTREKWYLQGDLPVLEDDVDFLQSWTLKRVLSVLLHVQIDFN